MPGLNHEYAAALGPVVDVLEQLDVSYYIGGSVASSQYGVARTTLDIDLVAALDAGHVAAFIDALEDDYYVAAEAIQRALTDSSCFNVIHMQTAIKVDVFVAHNPAHKRRQLHPLAGTDRPYYFAGPEDTILAKLDWYERGDRKSQRQWSDILGVLRVQGVSLDRTYLRNQARQTGLSELLEQAFDEAASM